MEFTIFSFNNQHDAIDDIGVVYNSGKYKMLEDFKTHLASLSEGATFKVITKHDLTDVKTEDIQKKLDEGNHTTVEGKIYNSILGTGFQTKGSLDDEEVVKAAEANKGKVLNVSKKGIVRTALCVGFMFDKRTNKKFYKLRDLYGTFHVRITDESVEVNEEATAAHEKRLGDLEAMKAFKFSQRKKSRVVNLDELIEKAATALEKKKAIVEKKAVAVKKAQELLESATEQLKKLQEKHAHLVEAKNNVEKAKPEDTTPATPLKETKAEKIARVKAMAAKKKAAADKATAATIRAAVSEAKK